MDSNEVVEWKIKKQKNIVLVVAFKKILIFSCKCCWWIKNDVHNKLDLVKPQLYDLALKVDTVQITQKLKILGDSKCCTFRKWISEQIISQKNIFTHEGHFELGYGYVYKQSCPL